MARQWYYAHSSQTHGPVSARKLKYLAATGGLQPQDLIWPEGGEPDRAVPAEKAIDFATLRRLAQEARARSTTHKPQPASDDLPEWLDGIDHLFRDPEQALGPVPDWLQPPRPAAAGLPDWLTDLPTADRPPEPEPSPPLAERVVPSASPVPIAPPIASPIGTTLLERMGIDPISQRVVDWARFEAWREAQRLFVDELPLPPDSDPDPFHTARKRLAVWFDLQKNRERLARGDRTGIHNDIALQRFMSHFDQFGRDKLARLWEYVDFLIETRRGS
jgi:hypothetical protein